MKRIFQCGYFLLAVYQAGQLITMINNGEDVAQVNTSGITNMRGLFKDAPSFNQDIGSWDVSDVTGMYGMFRNSINLTNQDLSSWNVSNVT